ncbi:hypothetical protein [Pontibacter harenae]|uniref:hypothetical protein n=1 Tax=Pontibacter harenae TaxID=2894083 RepID=UPI001E32EF6D|nr:hypothetical protein [Pontibacter harenae]MCC9167452.1 hypothetical protein [Pontibacter harenae]
MGLKDIINKAKKEIKVLQGEETKDKLFTNENTYPDEATAKKEFERAKRKLFNIDGWSDLEGISSTFMLYDNRGRRTTALEPEVGYYFKIILPASDIENWVKIADITVQDDMAQFVVHPSEKPKELGGDEEVIEHFFMKEASSTFKVERQGNKLIGYEIGKHEGINNQDEEAGDRAMLNTVVSEGGWAGFQDIQWDNLTRYLVHLDEAKKDND